MRHDHKQKAMDAKIEMLEQKATRRLAFDEVFRKFMRNRMTELATEELKKINGNGTHG